MNDYRHMTPAELQATEAAIQVMLINERYLDLLPDLQEALADVQSELLWRERESQEGATA